MSSKNGNARRLAVPAVVVAAAARALVTSARAKGRALRLSVVLLDEASTVCVLAISALIGGAIAFHVFGIRYVLGTSPFWSYPAGDAGTMLNGWNYLVHDEWTWPLSHTHSTHWPTGLTILYLDSIPLIAMVGKIFARSLPVTFHPYGAWHATIYVLQAIFGALLARSVGIRSLLGGASCALLSVIAPVFLLRFYHEGLNAHFVLLWALFNYFRFRQPVSTVYFAGGWAACLVCALLIHPYLAVMALAVGMTAHFELACRDRVRALISGTFCAIALATAWITAGYTFVAPTAGDAPGFGEASTNLMSFFVPFHSHLSPWLPPPGAFDTTGKQWDGQGFAGFGVLTLLALAITAGRDELRRVIWRHKLLVAMLLLSAAFALGPRWTFGQSVLLEVPISDGFRVMLATFRATGRFFWLFGYALMILSATVVIRRFGQKGVLIVAAAALLQCGDSSPSWKIISSAFESPWERYLEWTLWEPAFEGHRATVMAPSHNCWSTPPGDRILRIEREIEFMSARRGMQTNDGRTARFFTDCGWHDAEIARTAREGLEPETLYVLFRPAFDADAAAAFGGDRCIEVSEGWICSADRSAFIRRAFSEVAAGRLEPSP